jgi:hypothetical protein
MLYKIRTPGNFPEENIQHTEHGESLKSRIHLWLPAVVMAEGELAEPFPLSHDSCR